MVFLNNVRNHTPAALARCIAERNSPSNKEISFGEKGAGKRKIEAQVQLDVNFIVSCCFDSFTSTKLHKRLEPKGSDGAATGEKCIPYSTDPPT